MKRLACALFLWCVTALAHAEWVYFATSDGGDEFFLDPSTKKKRLAPPRLGAHKFRC